MKIVMGNFAQPTPDATTCQIATNTSDPVPTCQLTLYDANSSINPLFMQELLILDDQQIPNPTINLLLNPAMNPYTDIYTWTTQYSPPSGVTFSQNMGGGVIATFSNDSTNIGIPAYIIAQYTGTPISSITAGQSYSFSITIQGSSIVNVRAGVLLIWLDIGNNVISTTTGGPWTPTGSAQRFSVSAQAPANTYRCYVQLSYIPTSSTNSGSITYTNAMLEPQWFSMLSYPTSYCGPGQTNCRQLPLGQWIRQYRKFAGFVIFRTFANYRGNARDVIIRAHGYAWVLSTTYVNNSYSSHYDSYIINNLLATYFNAPFGAMAGTPMVDVTSVVQGVQLTSFSSNWDDIRTLFNNLASQSSFFWSIGYYWECIYAPPGYYTMAISLLCDGSGTPDNVTTFPAYAVESDSDFTQPGCNVLIFGASGFSAQILDPATLSQITANSGYQFPTGWSFARKVNDSSLGSNTDCTNRGMAELLQYDGPRGIYRYTTNVELIVGRGIAVTDTQNGLSSTVLLIQQVGAAWLGKNETLADVWEYKVQLGAINRQATNILSRLARQNNANTSAPAINVTTLAILERLGVTDGSPTTGSSATGYQATILGDNPLAYYRLDELLGTIADDFSGNANAGTLHGGVTLDATGLLHSGGDPAMTFDGSTGYISLPTGFIPIGSGHAWSLECWCKISAFPSGVNYGLMVGIGKNAAQQAGKMAVHNSGVTSQFVLATYLGDIQSGNISTATIYHVVGTYDGSNTRLYVNSSLVAGPTAFTVNLGTDYASIGADLGIEFFNGIIDEVAIYNYALTSTQISNHYTAGTT